MKKQRIAIGLGLSGLVGLLAYRRKMLTRGGVAGTVTVGTSVFAGGGWPESAAVIGFFASSSLLSRVASECKRVTAADKFSKSSTRDLYQTLANGGVGAVCAAAYGIHRRHPAWLRFAFTGAFATATADTWATEIGTLSTGEPRLLTTGRRVALGTSGAISLLGTTAATAGALGFGLAMLPAVAVSRGNASDALRLLRASVLAGTAGALIDSLLGATVQRINWCPVCESETEREIHRCGTPTTYLRGISWMDNDAVNLASTGAGAIIGAILGRTSLDSHSLE